MQNPPINLFRGWPNPSLLPVLHLSTASSTALSTPSIYEQGLTYGPDEGYLPLRRHIAHWLTCFYQPRQSRQSHPPAISELRICISGGASQNLACILQVFSDPVYTRHVWMIAPTYYLACRIMDDAGFAGRLRAIPEDDDGLDLAFLERELNASEARAVQEQNFQPKFKPPRPWRKIYKHIIYATPTFSNPSMKIMSLSCREALVRLARQYDALIVTDDVYDFLQWPSTSIHTTTNNNSTPSALPDKACVPRLVDVDRYLDGGPKDEWGNVVSNGSFSKLVGPGVRTGWAEGTEKFAYGLSQTGSSRSGGAPSNLTATVIDQLLSTSVLQNHILNVLRPAYSSRYHSIMLAIHQHLLPLGVTLPSLKSQQSVAGGYFIWITLPSPLRASDIAQRALDEENLKVAEGDLFRVRGDPAQNLATTFGDCLRICFAWEEMPNLAEGVRRLASVVERALSHYRSNVR